MSSQDEPKAVPICAELRCKGMFVASSASPEKAMIIPGDTTHWWCEQTQGPLGPDRDWVHRTVCTPGRECYRRGPDPT
jgi:hypothetical protein